MIVLLRRNFANRRRHARLDARPAIRVVHLRLVHHLEEHPLRIARRIVRGQLAPQHLQPLHRFVAAAQRHLVAVFRMQIDLHRQPVGQHRVHGLVEPRHKIVVQSIGPERTLLQRRGVNAQAHIVKAQLRNQRNVGGVGIAVRARRRVVARLRKPAGCVDPMFQVLRARPRNPQPGRAILGGRGQRQSRQHQPHQKGKATKAAQHGRVSSNAFKNQTR